MNTLFDVEETTPAAPDLPDLYGTEKQIPWAEQVRKKLLAEIDNLFRDWKRLIDNYETSGKDAEKVEQARAEFRRLLPIADEIRERNTCRWWLDRRDLTARELLSGAPPKPGDSYGSGG